MDDPSDPQVRQHLDIQKSAIEDSQIGGQAGRDLTQNQGSGNLFKDVTFNVFQSGPVVPPISPRDVRNRQILLNKVRHYWINEALEKSLNQQLQITIPLEKRTDAVIDPWAGLTPEEAQLPRVLPPQVTLAELFNQLGDGRTLLILGAPGSGKTIELLKLARFLVNQVEQGLYDRIPVVLNLSFWQSPRQSLAVWIQSELNTKYQVPRQVGKSWVESDQLCLLLDGLDEVADALRPSCIEAINHHHETHNPDMVVCCREHEYTELLNRLKFQAAVCLRPLDFSQIDQNLRALPDSAQLRDWLEADQTLKELAQSPLMLSLIVQSYRGLDWQSLPSTHVLADQRRQLFLTYVDQMLRRRARSMPYSASQTRCYLHQLAQYLNQISQSNFLIELMQPTWLATLWEQRLYHIMVKAILVMLWGGVHAGLLAGHIERYSFDGFRATRGALLGISVGLIYGVVGGWLTPSLVQKISPRWGRVINGIFLGSLYLPVFTWVYDIRGGIAYGLIYGLIGVWTYSALYDEPIEPAETVHWSQRRVAVNILFGVVIGLALFLGTQNTLLDSLLFGFIAGLIVFGFEKQSEVESTSFPNQGIWRSLKNSLRFLLIIGGGAGLLLGVLQGPISGAVNGLIFGIGAAILGGQGSGIVCTKHLVLRFLLWRKGVIPWNYRRFLEWGCDLNLLQRIGGGYGFIHRLLLEHLATSETVGG